MILYIQEVRPTHVRISGHTARYLKIIKWIGNVLAIGQNRGCWWKFNFSGMWRRVSCSKRRFVGTTCLYFQGSKIQNPQKMYIFHTECRASQLLRNASIYTSQGVTYKNTWTFPSQYSYIFQPHQNSEEWFDVVKGTAGFSSCILHVFSDVTSYFIYIYIYICLTSW